MIFRISIYRLFIIAAFLLCSASVFSQIIDEGQPFITNYSPKEYGYHPQNWSVVQDDRGVLYFGNNPGVLMYDGVEWTLINLLKNTPVRSLAIGDSSTVFVGSNNEFGYLKPDSVGQLSYHSMSDKLKEVDKNFSEIRRVITSGKKTYFIAFRKIFLFENGNYKVWNTTTEFRYAFYVNEHLYVRETGIGLKELSGDSLQMVPGGNLFADKVIYFMLPYNDQSVLIGTRENGLYLYKNINAGSGVPEILPFRTMADEYIIKNRLYHGIQLSSGNYALAVDVGGVIIIDKAGAVKNIFNKKSGLQSETVNYVFEDRQNNLWIALNEGISKIELNSSIVQFDQSSGLEGLITSIVRFQGRLYVSTMNGVFYLDANQKINAEKNLDYIFKKLDNYDEGCMRMEIVDDRLIGVFAQGIFEIIGTRAKILKPTNPTQYFYVWKKHPSLAFISSNTGVTLYDFSGGGCKFVCPVDSLGFEVGFMNEDSAGRIWLGGSDALLWRVTVNEKNGACQVEKFDTTDGLPRLSIVGMFFIKNQFYISFIKGTYRFGEKAVRSGTNNFHFILDPSFPLKSSTGSDIGFSNVKQDKYGNLWTGVGSILGWLSPDKGKYRWNDNPFLRLYRPNVFSMYVDSAIDLIWFGGPDGLFCFKPNSGKNYNIPFSTIITKIRPGNDSLVYAGFSPALLVEGSHFEYKRNTITINFASLFYERESGTLYSYFLEGFDESWSGWKRETVVKYTNLPEGDYVFRVKGKNIYGITSPEAIYKFSISPPWYRTWWAYLLYVASFLGLLIIAVNHYSKRLRRANIRLERTVNERTAEIIQQKEEIQAVNEHLSEINKELEKLSIVASETDNAIMIMGAEGNFEWINDGFKRMYGYTIEQLTSSGISNLRDYSSHPDIDKLMASCIHEKKTIIYESKTRKKDNSTLWTQTTLTPVLDQDKKVKKIVAIDSDISKLKQAQEEIIQQTEEIASQRDQLGKINKELEKLSIVARETDNAIIIMDAEGNFEWINESLTRIYGYTLEQFITLKGKSIIHSSANPNIKKILNTCIQEKKTVIYESQTKTIQGGRLWTQTTLTPILNTNGDVYKIIAIDSDISKIKKAEEKIRTQSELLTEKNDELERTNTLITESISYAKRIQDAIFPSALTLKEYLPESFVLFKPRDIVSGDYYWFYSEGNKFFIAIADCTGHGVPGAFMSMVGYTLLNEIVKEKKIYQPSLILDKLNESIAYALKQRDGRQDSQDDGMDITICVIDYEKEEIHISSANQVVCYLTGEKLNIINGDIYSVGGFFSNKEGPSYTDHVISLKEADELYLSTDGYQDQFGGKDDSKYTFERFRMLLLDSHTLPMEKQRDFFDKSFNKWKGDGRQIDDVLVVGFRPKNSNIR